MDYLTELESDQEILRAESERAKARLLLAALVLLLGGVGLLAVSATSSSHPFLSLMINMSRQIGAGLVVGGVGAALVRIFILRHYKEFEHVLMRFIRRDVKDELARIQERIAAQTEEFVQAGNSLESMRKSGIIQIYQTRAQASRDIADDLTNPSNSVIRIIGISMNDFVRGDHPDLHGAWRHLEDRIYGRREGSSPTSTLDIKVLLIDPGCVAARLRSLGESREPSAIAGRLETEVLETAQHMLKMKQAVSSTETRVSFDFRFYRVAPILFLCRTDRASYVQQYYFRASRHAPDPVPVIKYGDLPDQPGDPALSSLHYELTDHFDWIWKYGSVAAEDVLDNGCLGLDKGLASAGSQNVYNDPREGEQRIYSLLRDAKHRVWIQGVSLHSFFAHGRLFEAMATLVKRGDVDIRVLILDPDSEQAQYRSFRERLFIDRQTTFENFRKLPELHQQSPLYRDTKQTLENIREAILPQARGNFDVRLYSAAAACFVLIVDDRALVEQYHYGKIFPEDRQDFYPVILGKDMPIVEYYSSPSFLYDSDPLRNPQKLLASHFEFVFQTTALKEVRLDEPVRSPDAAGGGT